MIEAKLMKKIGDEAFGYSHLLIESEYEQHIHTVYLRPLKIESMIVTGKEISFKMYLFNFYIGLVIGI